MPGAIKPGATGAWTLRGSWPFGHYLDPGFALEVQAIVGSSSILDIGAGVGVYGAYFAGCMQGARPRWSGVDGTPGVEELSRAGPPGALTRHVDLCQGSADLGVHDWVSSFEVGEHLPQHCISRFLATIDRSNRVGVILSWAHHYQKGKGHISPRSGVDLARAMRFLGYDEDRNATMSLRNAAKFAWLQTNPRVYRRMQEGTPVRGLHHEEEQLRERQHPTTMSGQSICRTASAGLKAITAACERNRTSGGMCACMQEQQAACLSRVAGAVSEPMIIDHCDCQFAVRKANGCYRGHNDHTRCWGVCCSSGSAARVSAARKQFQKQRSAANQADARTDMSGRMKELGL